MSEDINKESAKRGREKISAYLDDALAQAELDALVDQQQEPGSGAASRYQMIGEVLRGQMSDASMVDVHLQVREALLHEEIKQEEVKREDIKRPIFDPIFDLASWFNHARLDSAWYRPVGGLAIAASVAMIMVVTTTHEDSAFDKGGLVAENAIEGVVTENITTDNTLVVSVPVSTVVANETGTPDLLDQSQINLNTYLAEHAEFAAQDTMQGRMPYVRAVSYESE